MIDRDKRASLRGLIGVGLGLVAARAGAQDQKLAKELVRYQDTPKDRQECDKCVNWISPNQCKIVAGPINPKGWCIAFAPLGG
jgi:hypothetical protein